MTIQRMEHVGIVVEDLAAATAFFVELGLKLQGVWSVEGGWVDRIVGLEGVQVDAAMMETPDGHGRLELVKFHAPSGPGGDRHAPANTPGLRHLAFAVDDIDAVVASLRARGAALVGEVEQYEDSYRLCYVRGPEGIIVELAEQDRRRAPAGRLRMDSLLPGSWGAESRGWLLVPHYRSFRVSPNLSLVNTRRGGDAVLAAHGPILTCRGCARVRFERRDNGLSERPLTRRGRRCSITIDPPFGMN